MIVNNSCSGDLSSVLTAGITDYVYYINENTEYGSWVNGNTPKPKAQTWISTFKQTVSGCPVNYSLYRTMSNGVRQLFTAYENTVFTTFNFPTISLNTPWSS